jgi:hypothetical protein
MRKIPLQAGDVMTPAECAKYLRMPADETPEALTDAVEKLKKWRHARKGPPFTKVEGEVKYLKPLIDDNLLEQTEKAS